MGTRSSAAYAASAVAGCVLAWLGGGPASAAAQDQQAVAAARQLFQTGLDAAADERWDDAIDAFDRSYRAAPRPVTLYNLAGAQASGGQLVAATESYRRFLHEATERRYASYRRTASTAVEDLAARLAFVTIEADGRGPEDAIRFDDQPWPAALLDVEAPVDPGPHTIEIVRASEVLDREEIELSEGERIRVSLEVPAALAGIDPETEGPRAGPDEDEGGGVWASPWFWLVTAAIVGAGAAIGLTFLLSSEEAPYQSDLGIVTAP
jgi:tetratricopeptide (TPR) repeat protein